MSDFSQEFKNPKPMELILIAVFEISGHVLLPTCPGTSKMFTCKLCEAVREGNLGEQLTLIPFALDF